MWLTADIETLQTAMQQGELSATALTQFYLERISTYDQKGPALNAIQSLNERALEIATALDTERASSGPRSPLHGIPVLVKDNYETEGMVTSAGSVLFAQYAPARDATLVARLKKAGAIILGKTTMHEFAYGITNVGSRYGSTKNPYDLQRNPGGSSGGTGAAVAARFASVGMGSDTCGSIRIPAAQNGLVGLRGTQGLSSRHGIIPLSSSQDIGGPLARSVRDLALVLDATVGFDAADPQTQASQGHVPASYVKRLTTLPAARIGLLEDWLVQDSADKPVALVIREALQVLGDERDWQIEALSSPQLNSAVNRRLNGHYVLIADFKLDINAYLQANPSLGYANLDALIKSGRTHPSIEASMQASAAMPDARDATYAEELQQRQVVQAALAALMDEHNLDALAYPTIRQIAAPLGVEQQGTNCRLAANSGFPAISVPVGEVGGIPVGLEFLARPFAEAKLLNLAYTVEQQFGQRPLPAATP